MQRNLLDTHTLIWFLNGDEYLSDKAKKAIENSSVNYISIASLWEMAIKISLNKLEINTPFHLLSTTFTKNGFEILPLTFQDTLTVSTLPFHHRDPFDRMIIAQALSNDLEVITKDEQFSAYTNNVIW